MARRRARCPHCRKNDRTKYFGGQLPARVYYCRSCGSLFKYSTSRTHARVVTLKEVDETRKGWKWFRKHDRESLEHD